MYAIQLIPVISGQINGQMTQMVDARLLHRFLASGQDFSTWIKGRIRKYEFVEQEDYLVHKFVDQLPSGAKLRIEYHLTLDMAVDDAQNPQKVGGGQCHRHAF